MSEQTHTRIGLIRMIRVLWNHLSAVVALVLIVGALMIGYSIGRPGAKMVKATDAPESEPEAGSTPQMYTCSMHPSVRLSDPDSKCPICHMDLIPVVESGDDGANPLQLTLSESAKIMSKIETTKVGRFFPTAETRLYGKLVYDETSVARLTAYFPGRIDRLFVNYVGVTVQRGDHLAQMYSPDLISAFEELRQSKKSYDQAMNTGGEFLRQTAQQTLTASREKLRLYGLTQEQIKDAESGSSTSDELTIYAPIGGVVTHLTAREGEYLKTGEQIATVSDLSRLWLDLEAYESQLPMLRWGLPVTFTVEAHPGEVFEGRVSFIEPIVDEHTRTAAVRVAVDNADGRLKPGMFSTAVVHAKIGEDGAVLNEELAGKWVGPMHPTIIKDEPGACDICGMDLVSAESLGIVGDPAKAQKPLVIPRSAVLFTGKRSVVYIQVPDEESPTYEAREVELGTLAGDDYTVRSGLKEGDEVVVHGAFRIDSSMQILAKPSMMMPAGGASGAGHHHDGDMASMLKMDRSKSIPEEFLANLSPVYTSYLDAQESLAGDDLEGFLDAAKRVTDTAIQIDPIGLVSEPLGTWRRASVGLSMSHSITTLDDARIAFESMTEAVLELQSEFGNTTGETLYTAFCPMAFDFKGAKWIQRGTDIRNPYFGSEMLTCGDIQETTQSIARPAEEGAGMKLDMDMDRPSQDKGLTHE
ncbi:MAG: efflux RND transporter periplasmic adaptor subunit [Phycisphaerales bacterium]